MKNRPHPRSTRKNVKNAPYVTHLRMSENTRLRFQAIAHRLEEKEGSPMSDSLVFQKILEKMGL